MKSGQNPAAALYECRTNILLFSSAVMDGRYRTIPWDFI
jgi:hypothetical protein